MTQTKRRTGIRRSRTELKRPVKRWLFAHPSWLSWWWLKNAEANPEWAKLITGVFCVFVESASGNDSVKHYKEMKERCEALGWEFTPGLRFSHRSRADWSRMTNIEEHKAIIRKAAKWTSLMLDMEAYGVKGTRYHSGGEAYELHAAAEPWRKFGKPLYVYPPQFQAPGSILNQTRHSYDSPWPIALDHSTYEAGRFNGDLKAAMVVRCSYYLSRFSDYCPGFYLKYIQNRPTMAAAAKYGSCWFFPSSKGDDRSKFMTPDWSPSI